MARKRVNIVCENKNSTKIMKIVLKNKKVQNAIENGEQLVIRVVQKKSQRSSKDVGTT